MTTYPLNLNWWWLRTREESSSGSGDTGADDCSTITWPGDLLEGWTLSTASGSGEVGSGSGVADGGYVELAQGQPAGIGAGCVLLGALLIALGANLLRKASKRKCVAPIWLIGLILLAGGHALTFIALVFASMWFVALLGLWSALLFNAIIARLLFKEPLGVPTAIGVLNILCGLSAFIVFGSPPPVADLTASQMNARWLDQLQVQPFWIVHAGCTVVITLLAELCDCRLCVFSKAGKEHKARVKEMKSAAKASGVKYEPTYTGVPVALAALKPIQVKTIRVLMPLAAGLLAGWSALLSDSLGQLLQAHFRHPSVTAYGTFITSPDEVLYLLLGSCIPLLFQTYLLGRSLALFSPMSILPIFYVPFVLTAVGGNGVFYGSYRIECFGWRFAPFFAGLAASIFGVLLITCGRPPLATSSAIAPDPYDGEGVDYAAQARADYERAAQEQAAGARAAAMKVGATIARDAELEAAFDAADINKDGKLDRQEFERFLETAPQQVIQSMTPNKPPLPPVADAYALGAYTGEAPADEEYIDPTASGAWVHGSDPLPQPPLPWESAAATTDLATLPADETQAREYLHQELEAQRQQIAQLQQAMLDMMQQQPQGGGGGGGLLGGGPSRGYGGYDHASGSMLPQPPLPPIGMSGAHPLHRSASASSQKSDPASWQVPDGTQAGQVFLVDGEYYVAVPRPAPQKLPPVHPSMPR